jgi:cation:H+ antiporter
MPRSPLHRQQGLVVRGLVLLHPLDVVIATLVVAFFLLSALIQGGQVLGSLQGALLIMLVMFVVGAAIEVIIEALRDLPGLGTAVGFITNGPEALCLLVGLLTGDIIYAASTPLGSNFMNPVMLFSAALIVGGAGAILRQDRTLTLLTLLVTATLAGIFFALPERWYWPWAAVTVLISLVLFLRRSQEAQAAPSDSQSGLRPWHAIPATLLLVLAGYWLDPVVSLTAEASRAPKGLIGFFVLAALTSWPEFRSCLGLLRRGRATSAVVNITVSNLTNLWLAVLGVLVFKLVG